MKITPVFENTDKHTIPLWLIEDVEIPNSITQALSEPNSWSDYSKTMKDEEYAQGHSDRLLHRNSKFLSDKLNKETGLDKFIIKHLSKQKDYDYNATWPSSGVEPYLDRLGISYAMVKDSVNYKQHPHVDNFFVFGTVLLNLKDNHPDSGTVYYDYKEYLLNGKQTRVYKGPYKKGTGLLHVNTPHNLHEGWNEGDFDRYVAFGNICLI